ncbi:hypothetical protein HMPREF9441_02160 [Paraprevotella clara YIT 11840]|uniref:Uncharacterized protein n=1 Tax=Paraprevotella clara YIT 11840 TaxID=762968 RepID=G5SS11_9BACT|nr:hypothetical protein HMPREF9441_02160 [Paraprevotella clara YIT 11840]
MGYVFIRKTQGKRFCNKEHKKLRLSFLERRMPQFFGTDAGNVSGKKRPAILA